MDKFIEGLDRQFAELNRGSHKLIEAISPELLYRQPPGKSNSLPLHSCGEHVLRSAAAGLAALALAGHAETADVLFEIGIPARDDSTRAPAALAVATIALRNTSLLTSILEKRTNRAQAIDLVAEGFDMLEEDLDKEAFFAFARRTYWASPDGSPTRELMQTLIGKLDF